MRMNLKEPLWKKFIKESGFNGISIPYLVGKFYKAGIITDKDLLSSNCIKIILLNIVNSAVVGDEAAILLCNN